MLLFLSFMLAPVMIVYYCYAKYLLTWHCSAQGLKKCVVLVIQPHFKLEAICSGSLSPVVLGGGGIGDKPNL